MAQRDDRKWEIFITASFFLPLLHQNGNTIAHVIFTASNISPPNTEQNISKIFHHRIFCKIISKTFHRKIFCKNISQIFHHMIFCKTISTDLDHWVLLAFLLLNGDISDVWGSSMRNKGFRKWMQYMFKLGLRIWNWNARNVNHQSFSWCA